MSPSFFFTAALSGLLLSAANAHMVIKSPVPYGKDSLTNSPLAGDGSDFPCKQRSGVYDVSQVNSMAVGTPQTLSFTGSAVHGGGSCQLSVSLDQQPSKDSQWKVIHSIVSGCPSNVTGNLNADPNGGGAAQFEYSIPQGMPNGQYTLAWTWFNKVGNREMYMNCAPIQVTGGADSKDVFNSLPDMFVANIPSTTCGTAENEDLVFPNPGQSAETRFSTALGSSTVGSSCQKATGAPGGNSAATSSAAAYTASTTAGGNAGGGNKAPALSQPTPSTSTLLTIASSSSADAGSGPSTITTMLTVTASSAQGSSSTNTAAPAAPAASGTCASGSIPCPNPGSIICVSSTQFGLCDINYCAVAQDVAQGTTCSDGTVMKRSSRHLRRHLDHAF